LTLSKQEKRAELWRRGILHWKCHSVQKEMYDIFTNAPAYSTMYWLLARQSGKSWLLAILALEQALKKPNSVIKLLTDTKVHVESIFEPLFKKILKDCPEDVKPEYKKQKYIYYFPNGSQIQLAGSDNGHYEKLRGQTSDLVLIDEAGFCNKLKHIVKSVLFPTLTHTRGKLVLATTPAEEPDHESYRFQEKAEMKGTLTKKIIYDNPLLDQDQIDRIIEECGGTESVDFRREYLCERIRDEDNTVFPEFDTELENKIVRDDWVKPPFYDTYVGMDVGFKDFTAVIFAYYDFRNDKIIVEDEIVLKGKDFVLEELGEMINKKEQDLWTNPLTNEVCRPKVRVSDVDYIVINEISKKTNGSIAFTVTRKDDPGAAINNLRSLIAGEKIIIHPRCINFIRHIRNCQWYSTGNKLKFARSADNGHYDTIDAAKYMVRYISFNQNPYPPGYQMDVENMHFRKGTPDFTTRGDMSIYKKIFNIKKKY